MEQEIENNSKDFLAENKTLKAEIETLTNQIGALKKIIFDLKNSTISLDINELSDDQFTSSEDESDDDHDNNNDLYEIVYNDINYYTDGDDVYEIDENGDIGNNIGTYKDGSVIFFDIYNGISE